MHQPLAALKDIHLPEPVSAWPLAPGWYVLALCIVIIGTIASLWGIRYWYRRRIQRLALKQLTQLQKRHQSGQVVNNIAQHVSLLLRKVALFYYPDEAIAGLTGESWLAFLDRTGKTDQFSQHQALFVSLPYQRNADVDVDTLLQISIQWVRTCHV